MTGRQREAIVVAGELREFDEIHVDKNSIEARASEALQS
jgi:hypothetical protein